jgi:hypothetical protein
MVITGTTYSVSHYEEYRKGNSNIFEEVIDSMILDGIAGMNESFRSAILNLPIEDKRMAILSLLDKDLNLFKKIKALTNKKIDRLEHIKDIILMLREYVKVGEVEKKKFGEVMTPLELVKEMLATLPEEVWSNPNLKWLDPANGTGPYPAVVIYKLMNGLEEWEPDAEKRYKHIIENMIYTCELQAKNVFLWLCVADPFDEYNTNTYWGSFLDEKFDKHMKEVWGIDKVDIVMGNPPYNDENSSGNSLWSKFILQSINILSHNGYITMIVPGRWILPGYNIQKGKIRIWDIFSKMNPIHFNVGKCSSYFTGIGSDSDYFSFFCVNNNKNKGQTLIESNLDKFIINIEKTFCLPYKNCDKNTTFILNKVLVNNLKKFKFIWKYDRSQVNLESNSNNLKKYKVFLGKDNIKYSDHPSDYYNQSKVIFKLGRFITYINRLCIDYRGDINFNSAYVYILKKDENVDYLSSKLYKFIGDCLFNGSEITAASFNQLPNLEVNNVLSDDQLFGYFDLTDEEINLVLNYENK